jgi:hypothetical protein
VTSELEAASGGARLTTLDEERAVERALWLHVFKASLVAIPICVAIWVGLVALAIADTNEALLPPLAIGAVIGVIAGVFFGGWAGFLAKAHTLDELDRKVARR